MSVREARAGVRGRWRIKGKAPGWNRCMIEHVRSPSVGEAASMARAPTGGIDAGVVRREVFTRWAARLRQRPMALRGVRAAFGAGASRVSGRAGV